MSLQIVTTQRKWDTTCTKSSNLTENQISRPEIRDIIMYAEPRMLSTLIAAGVESSWQTVGTVAKTKIGVIPKDKLIGSNAYIYEVMTRIQRNTEILGQVGSSGADGTFRLRLKDNIFYPGMNTQFHNDSFSARCMSVGVPSTTAGGGWVFEFKTNNGHVFDYSLDVAPQPGTKTCFGGNTSYEEGSKRGYSYSFFGDKYVNHLTTQRKSIGMTGDALTDVTWVMYNGEKGWFFTKEARLRLQMMMEDEHAKWHGRSTMRDEDGNLLSKSNQLDPETGNEVIAGDGVIPQIEDGNVAWGSGDEGMASFDDFVDMIKLLRKYSNTVYQPGVVQKFYVVTGPNGYANAQNVLMRFWLSNQNGSHMVQGQSLGEVEVGGDFNTMRWLGTKLTFVEHPMFGDEQRYSAKSRTGDPLMSGTYIFLDANKDQNGRNNIEILGKGAYGINRTNVSGYINGMTGYNHQMTTPVDALEYHTLKQDGIFIYNIKSCGIIKQTPTLA